MAIGFSQTFGIELKALSAAMRTFSAAYKGVCPSGAIKANLLKCGLTVKIRRRS